MFNVVIFEKQEKYINDFLMLPKLLYSSKEIMQNEQEERKIIEEKHVLNKYFKQYKILIYSEDRVCGRCIITKYPNTEEAYIGYFECIEDLACSKLLFQTAEKYAKKEGVNKIVGPVDSSFWIKYRLKVDCFDMKPYVGEPYNKKYYKDMFEINGYSVLESWTSNIYIKPPLFYNKKMIVKDRLKRAKLKKYNIITPKINEFDKYINVIYDLINELYKEFITYKKIEREDFIELFKDYKYIVDCNFFKIVYLDEEPVAFSIVLPNYHNLLINKLTLFNKIKLMLKKIRSDSYVCLYMGVKKGHEGLGIAMAQELSKNLYIRRSSCIGALITSGKVTEKYMSNYINKKSKYYLYKKNI